MADGIRIDALKPTVLPDRDFVLPVMKDGLSNKLTVGQVLDILVGTAPGTLDTIQEIAAWIADNEDTTAAMLTALNNKLEKAGTNADPSLLANIQAVSFAVQSLSLAQKLQTLKNIGAQGSQVFTKNAASFTVTTDEVGALYLVTVTSGNVVATLPAAATAGAGAKYTFKLVSVGTARLIVDPNGSETIDGAATADLYMAGESITIESDGTAWRLVDKVEVVQSGSNSNGDFVKRSNGLLSCYRGLTLNNTASLTWISANVDWAIPFVRLDGAQICLGSPISNTLISSAIAADTTKFTAYLVAQGDIPSQALFVRGEGTWK